MSFLILRRTMSAFASLTLLAACGDGSESVGAAGGATALSVSFNSQAPDSTAPANRPMTITAGADTMIISRVQLVVDEFEMEREGASSSTSCSGSDTKRASGDRSMDDGNCSRLDRGPFLLELPLGGARTALAVTVPAGRYDEFELELDAVDDTPDSDDDADDSTAKRAFLAANPTFRNVSVRVEGTYRGTAFVFTSRPEIEMEFEFEPSLVVEAGVNDNITVDVDLARWFRSATGAVLAPTPANRSLIDSNIIASFKAFGDRNRDGREDDGRGRSRRVSNDD
jgi:hypothetical protein